MSLLNKFIAPELKIKSKSAKGARVAAASSKHSFKPSFGIVAAGKSGMTLGNLGSLKSPVTAQGAQGAGGGGKK